MKRSLAFFAILISAIACLAPDTAAQEDRSSSSSGIVRRRGAERSDEPSDASSRVTDRMQQRFDATPDVGDADRAWMRVIYRQLDLDNVANAPLYYPVDVVDGEENLFRIIMRLLMSDRIKAYEYLDGREEFSDKYRLPVRDLLDKCYIAYTEARGSTDKSPKFEADESDIPAEEVLRYYIIEQWEFDRRNNRMQRKVTALCPVLMRTDDYTSEPMSMPLFWVKYDDLRPHLMTRSIFLSDDNNLPSGTYDDFFTLGSYKGDIYKTRNLRNLTMAQMYADPDDRRRAQDSIQAVLDSFELKLWVPSLEELEAMQAAREQAAAGNDSTAAGNDNARPSRSRSAARTAKPKKPRKPKASPSGGSGSSGGAARSVRNRRR